MQRSVIGDTRTVSYRLVGIGAFCFAVVAVAGGVAAAWAAVTVSVAAGVYLAGPAVILAGAAVIAVRVLAEQRATHVRDLNEANAREDDIARS